METPTAHGAAVAAAEPPGRTDAAATAVVMATAPQDGADRPCALLELGDGTVLSRLLGQLEHLGVRAVHVLTRPGWVADVRSATGRLAQVHAGEGVEPDLRTLARIAGGERGALVVLAGDIVTDGEALAALLADPRTATGALTAAGRPAVPLASPVRLHGARFVSASSPYHTVSAPTSSFLGVLKVAAEDRAVLAETAGRLAELAASSTPEAGGTDDVPSMVLVGLVRGGAVVRASLLGRLYWARTRSPEAVAAVREQLAAHDEDRARLDSAVKGSDGFFTTFLVSPYSRHIARWAARRGLTPDQVTTVSLLLGVAAAALFATGERWGLVAGAIALQAAFTADCVDGQLARYSRQFSAFGGWLDAVFDRAKEYAAFAGLAVGASAIGDPVWTLAASALILQTVRHAGDFAGDAACHERLAAVVQPPLEQRADRAAGRPRAASARAGGARGLLSASRGLDRGWVRWVKRLLAFPIGERFLVISVTAALFTPRTTFVVLLAWGGVAAAYTLMGRLLRVAAPTGAVAGARAPRARPASPSALRVHRDDGPVARALGAAAAPVLGGTPAASVALAGILPLLAMVAIGGAGTGRWPAAAALGWLVIVTGASSGAAHGARTAWAVPPLLRAGEYVALVWVAALAGPSSIPAAFLLLCSLAYRAYDLVYRLQFRGTEPPAWLGALALGWDGRVALAFVLLVAGALPGGYDVWAAAGAAVFAGEAVWSWVRPAGGGGPAMVADDDEEHEIQ